MNFTIGKSFVLLALYFKLKLTLLPEPIIVPWTFSVFNKYLLIDEVMSTHVLTLLAMNASGRECLNIGDCVVLVLGKNCKTQRMALKYSLSFDS